MPDPTPARPAPPKKAKPPPSAPPPPSSARPRTPPPPLPAAQPPLKARRVAPAPRWRRPPDGDPADREDRLSDDTGAAAAGPTTPPPRSPSPTATVSEGPSRAPPSSSASSQHHSSRRPARDVPRRAWNRRALETSGISQELLAALDTFTRDVPPIPTHLDVSRKIPIRNMRKWITDLEMPAHNAVWGSLIDVLRRDVSVQRAWGSHWDFDLCRFILGVLVSSEDHTKHRADRKQTRQAVNNAIKRELTCPIETGSSSRSKTFRDLFREKCHAGGVRLPELESNAKATRAPSLPRQPPVSEAPAPPAANVNWVDPFVSGDAIASLPVQFARRRPSAREAAIWIAKCRENCPATDEWGSTAWWELKSDHVVTLLPYLLAIHSLFELRALLVDFRWMIRTFRCVDFSRGMRQVPTMGYDCLLELARKEKGRFPPLEIEGFRLIRNALMLIAPILAKDSPVYGTAVELKDKPFIAHLATQLVGRLLNLKRRFPNIACLIQSIEAHAPRPWLRPLTPCFQEPRTDIRIAVPSNGKYTPHLIALSEDGSLLATSGTEVTYGKEGTSSTKVSKSSSKEKNELGTKKIYSIRIWDVASGKEVCMVDTFRNHASLLAIARDHSCVIAGTQEGLFFWQLERRGDRVIVQSRVDGLPKPKPITSITPTARSRKVLTTSRSFTGPVITLWDTQTGKREKNFSSVKSRATCIDVSLDGEYFASGHNNGFIHLWHLGHRGEDEPVLSFKNEGAVAENGQQHVVLKKVNSTLDDMRLKTISISFYEKGEESWLATVSANHVIRVWELPPRNITREGRTFVSSLRTAVLKCPDVRDVQWSQKGVFYSAGDDGIARMWARTENGEWEPHAIEREKRERSSGVSSVLISSGKRSELVATYVTKSPYVTVWDMSGFGGENWVVKERAKLYRPYFCMVKESVDATDIRHLTDLDRASRLSAADRTTTISTNGVSGQSTRSFKNIGRFPDDISPVRSELQKYFRTLDVKNSTRPVGEMQPRLQMWQEKEWARPLEVCFEQPVITGVSGIFHTAAGGGGTGAQTVAVSRPTVALPATSGSAVMAGDGQDTEAGRRGMVAALQDGAVGIFELEERIGPGVGRNCKDEVQEVTVMGASGERGGASDGVNGHGSGDHGEKKVGGGAVVAIGGAVVAGGQAVVADVDAATSVAD